MKFLTLNTHSWMEENPQQKFEDLAKDILDKQYDIICFQEINQNIQSPLAPVNDLYHPTPSAEPIHQDHYVRCLVEKLEEAGLTYHWTWAYNHIGYDRYHEGVAILSRSPIHASELLVSDVDDPADYHTRRIAIAETHVDGKEIIVASVHLSWWDKGFQNEWARLEKHLSQIKKPLILAGDFNNPAGQEGYEAILDSSLELQDSFIEARHTKGTYTVGPGIDGWDDNQVPLRIDYVFASKEWQIESLEVVFDGSTQPLISDHYGLTAVLHLS